MNKHCRDCGEYKEDAAFYTRIYSSGRTALSYKCKICHSVYNKRHYIENKEAYKTQARKAEAKKLLWYKDLKKSLKCASCEENHPMCLEFHHSNDDKEFNVSTGMTLGYGRKRIISEINKCTVLCTNCHRKHHYPHVSPLATNQ